MLGDEAANAAALDRYYRFHSRVYDLTRWAFLFGRSSLVRRSSDGLRPRSILEVGCGTGELLVAAARQFPEAAIVGIDLSEPMLKVARRKLEGHAGRVRVVQQTYASPAAETLGVGEGFDLIIMSYALSMFGLGATEAIRSVQADLSDRGRFAAVDFHDTPLPPFERWMALNHVRMRGELLPALERAFDPKEVEIRRGFGGVWRYLTFVGRKRACAGGVESCRGAATAITPRRPSPPTRRADAVDG